MMRQFIYNFSFIFVRLDRREILKVDELVLLGGLRLLLLVALTQCLCSVVTGSFTDVSALRHVEHHKLITVLSWLLVIYSLPQIALKGVAKLLGRLGSASFNIARQLAYRLTTVILEESLQLSFADYWGTAWPAVQGSLLKLHASIFV